MKKLLIVFCAIALALGVSTSVNAELFNRGGGMIYDDVLKITWLQDANYAKTSSYDDDGEMTWADAVAWADQLVYGGFDDWRLPTTVDGPFVWGYDGTTTGGYNVTTSEMGHMYYVTLGNLGQYAIDGTFRPTGWGLANAGPFDNLQRYYYWSGTEYGYEVPNVPSQAWDFSFKHGMQGVFDIDTEIHYLYAWAVRDGDVGDPESIAVDIDIKFCSNPNAFNCKSRGKTPVTIFGTEDLDVTEIDISSLRLCIDGICVESPPSSWSVADRGDPTIDLGAEECAIVDEVEQDYLNPDGYDDLDVAFDSQEIVALIDCSELRKNDVSDTLYLTGEFEDGTSIYSEPVGDPGIDQLVKKNK